MKKLMSKATIVVATIGLVAVSAHAGPPRDSGKTVIELATAICAGLETPTDADEQIRADACDLLMKSDGDLDLTSSKCKVDPDYPDEATGNGYATYSLRNCAKNEASQHRKAASVVLSMDDVVVRHKAQQAYTAAKYACEYASKATALEAVGKLDMHGADPDLIEDAEAIADALEYPCE